MHDVEAVVARAVRLVTTGRVVSVDGGEVAVQADSLCVHGDTPGALSLVRAIRARFAGAGIGVAAFAP
jgi:5-oxoprolinase (ATP-hydrolysing) subunit A